MGKIKSQSKEKQSKPRNKDDNDASELHEDANHEFKLDFTNLIDDIEEKKLSHKIKDKHNLINKVQFKASKKLKNDSNILVTKVKEHFFFKFI